MMINKRLIGMVGESKKYIAGNVAAQWISLVANIVMMAVITTLLANLYMGNAGAKDVTVTLLIAGIIVGVRYICAVVSARMSFLSSKKVKSVLREKIYCKLLRLGNSYREKVQTSEIVQVAVEGVDQLETYFGAYLPQFFYAIAAPVTLFVVLCFINVPAAVVLFVCVPMIPVEIVAVQRWAKKLLAKYWGQYTALGDTFLENLQGLTTLKIYQADEAMNEKMNREAESFRRITMKVLTMQLNSISVMDLVAYGGAACGIILAAVQYGAGKVSLAGCLFIILLSADFFIPMRLLGSFFHIAMNGMAASDKMFRLLDLPENGEPQCSREIGSPEITCEHLTFSYEENRQVLRGIDMQIPKGSFVAIAGESGCGKSTIASLLMGRHQGYTGTIRMDGIPLKLISEEKLMKTITYVSHQSYIFKGTIRENLRMGNPEADDALLWSMLERTGLADTLRRKEGLDTLVAEKGGSLSGGQCQRLALARALLHDTPVYIFDEATSNIDAETENDIMREIGKLAKKKTVILISHRLANLVHADRIYVLHQGTVAESGTHEALLKKHGIYENMWNTQQELLAYVGEETSVDESESLTEKGKFHRSKAAFHWYERK